MNTASMILIGSAEGWRAALQQRGYAVEIGNLIIDAGGGGVFTLRFRSMPVFGDVVASPGAAGCQVYKLRLQYSGRRDGSPEEWKSRFALAGIEASLRDGSPEWLVFQPNKEFPPGYP